MKAILFDQARPIDERLRSLIFDKLKKVIEESGDEWETYNKSNPDQFGDVAITWGIRSREDAVRVASSHIVIENGFLGNRTEEYFSMTYSGLNGKGSPIADVINWRGEEFYHLLKERKPIDGKKVIVLGQVCGDTNLMAFGNENSPSRRTRVMAWLRSQVELWSSRGYEVAFKPHPFDPISKSMSSQWGIRVFHSLDEAFKWADKAVSFNSNSLVDAYLAGLEVLPADNGSLAWPVRHRPIGPEICGRDWLDYVASHQWHINEFMLAWKEIRLNYG